MEAIIKELKQVDNGYITGKIVIVTIESDTLTDEDKLKSLDAVNLIEENKMGL